ncbi:MAG TPA: hypothetical protein VGQ57_17450 [Polyangiaceae bacterium]|nr:hypothetical protein [Polyangiaceae bacterium]
MRPISPRTLALAALLAFSARARATEARDATAAEALFEQGKALLEHGDVEAACPKFAESNRLDPATGTLYALALCHERSGKLATAWAEFIETAGRANGDHNGEREQAARQRAAALQARLSFLEIQVDPLTAGLPGLSVSYDGGTLRPAAFGTSLPVDPGTHVVRAEAPNHRAWEGSVEVGTEPERATLTVPALEALPDLPPPPPPVVPPPKPLPAPRDAGAFELTPLRLGGIALGAAGLASLGFATAASVRALNEKARSEDSCDASGCADQAGQDARIAAREAATWATVGAISGAVLLGAGVILYVVGKPAARHSQAAHTVLLVGHGLGGFRHEF